MSDVLDRAKDIERGFSSNTTVHIRLALLQDLIAEIEKLEAERPLRAVKVIAEKRHEGAV